MRSSRSSSAHEPLRRDVVYKGIRVFVKAFREQIANNRLQLRWEDPPRRDERVRLGIEPPYMGRVFDIDANVVFVGDGFVGLELTPLNSRQRYELEGHARMCELIKQDFIGEITKEMASSVPHEPIVGLPAQLSRVPAREDLVCLDVDVSSVVAYMEVYKLQLNWRDMILRMPKPPPKGTVVQISLAMPRQATEVDLRGKVMEILADGARLEMAPYSRETRMQLMRHMHLLEHAAGEVAFEMKQEFGGDAMHALKALLPRATTRPVYSTAPKADMVATPTEAEPAPTPVRAAPSSATEAPADDADRPSIFRRRRMSRTVTKTGGHVDRVEPDRFLESESKGEPAADTAEVPAGTAAADAPSDAGSDDAFVVPVLKGDVPDAPAPEYAINDAGRAVPTGPAPAWASAPMPGSFELPPGTEDFVDDAPSEDDPFADLTADLDLEAPDDDALSGAALDAIFGSGGEGDDGGASASLGGDDWSVPAGAPWLQAGDSPGEDEDLEPEALGSSADDGAQAVAAEGGEGLPDPHAGSAVPVGDGGEAASEPGAPQEDEEEASPLIDVDAAASDLVDDLDGLDGGFEEPEVAANVPVSSKGNLAEQPILAVFAALRSRTGVLTIKGEHRTARIKLLKGKVCEVEDDPAEDKTLFGQILLGMGFHKMPVMNAIDASKESDKRIGDLLLEDGTAVPSMLKQAAVIQLKMRIGGLDGFEDGTYSFKEMVPRIGGGAARVGAIKVLFRGRLDWYIKRPSRQNQQEANKYSDADVRRTSLGRRWVNKLGLALPQQGLWELAATDKYKLAELKSRISFDSLLADATLFTLRDLGCLEFKEKDKRQIAAEAARKRIEDRYRRKNKNLFAVLDLHWTATDKAVEDAYRRYKRAYDPARLIDPDEKLLEKSEAINQRADEAYEVLRKAATRAPYRDEVISEDDRRTEAESQVKSSDVALFKGDAAAAIHALATAVELYHDHEIEVRLGEALDPEGLKRLMKLARQGEVEHQTAQDRVKTSLDEV